MKKSIFAILYLSLALVILAGCGQTSQGNVIRGLAQDRGAEIFDEGLENAEWFICRAASVGAVMRRYGSSAVKAAAWRALCLPDARAVEQLFAPNGEAE